MTVKMQGIARIALVVFSWSTLIFFGKNNMKRFFPATLVLVLFEIINGMIGKKRKWWFFYNKPHSHLFGEFPFYIGPFLTNSLWILKCTYGNFKKFILTNAAIDFLFTFPLIKLFGKVKYISLKKLNHFQFFLYYFYKAFLLYGIQYLFEKNYALKDGKNNH
ncbi:hypothetical protein [Heyndrickxia acidiproducens]|uniref:hypothetical protein n=1 Tax=Heyndrickxia acidiproducens TaxID=1121084 RepID=UPI00036F0707|nr:hypothetical protein [Heyndrickxia acidiproducens]